MGLRQLSFPRSCSTPTIVLPIPLALKGSSTAHDGSGVPRNNLLIYGLGGLIVPFIGIKLIDITLVALGVEAERPRHQPE